MAASRNRIRTEVAKGVEALRKAEINLMDNLAGSVTYVGIIGPFEHDIDVMEIAVTTGIKPAANGANTLDVFNGTVAGASTLMVQMTDALATYGWTAQTIQVPVKPPVTGTGRVSAGTPITVRFVAAGSNAAAPTNVTVRIGYDVPVYDQNARTTTYGAYDDGL